MKVESIHKNSKTRNERKKEAYKSNPDIDINRTKDNYHIIQAPKYTYGRKIKDLIKKYECKTWLFKLADNLDNLYKKLLDAIEDINFIGLKKDKAEAMEILSEFVPKVQKSTAKVNSYNNYIKELEIKVANQKINNNELVEENNELKEKIENKEFETSMKLQNMQKQINKYEKYIKKVPKEILDEDVVI